MWTLPIVTDNSGHVEAPVSNFEPGDVFPVGTTWIVYKAKDRYENYNECSFFITVEGKLVLINHGRRQFNKNRYLTT